MPAFVIYFRSDQVIARVVRLKSNSHSFFEQQFPFIDPCKVPGSVNIEGLSCFYEQKEPNNTAINVYLKTDYLWVCFRRGIRCERRLENARETLRPRAAAIASKGHGGSRRSPDGF